MTVLRAITKLMAHLTLASHDQPPQSTLVICFGMGTTFRSAATWDVPVTVVDLIPSVPKLFYYYHQDASQVLATPNAHVVVDDGEGFWNAPLTFDSIIVDPPPPVPAAGSSLLYSGDFCRLARQHLRTGGIFQQWLPEGDPATQSAVAQALKESFPYVRVFGYPGDPGLQFLASVSPVSIRTPVELVGRMPAKAVADLLEWTPQRTPESLLRIPLAHELSLNGVIARSPGTPALQDDRPVNEYYFLRTPATIAFPVRGVRRRLYYSLALPFPASASASHCRSS
jgi:hypothetical protein